jgi:hypothetical protein
VFSVLKNALLLLSHIMEMDDIVCPPSDSTTNIKDKEVANFRQKIMTILQRMLIQFLCYSIAIVVLFKSGIVAV